MKRTNKILARSAFVMLLLGCSSAPEPNDTLGSPDVVVDTTTSDSTTTKPTTSCETAEDCPSEQGCRATTGVCGPCFIADHCREGEACVDGQCNAGCAHATDCSGRLCVAAWCAPCEDDGSCGAQYDPAFTCVAGRCSPASCSDSSDCQQPVEGGYSQGTLCMDGVCVVANCETNASCPDDNPICGSDFRCRGCQDTQECAARDEGESSVCDVDTGKCRDGDCFPAGSRCGVGGSQICSNTLAGTFECGPCTDNSQCSEAIGDAYLCIAGDCREAECDPDALIADGRGRCGLGRVCDEDLLICRDCSSSVECPIGYLCDLGDTSRCLQGNCTRATQDSECPSKLCDPETRTCSDCDGEGSCGLSWIGEPRVCDNGVCVEGECIEDANCSSQKCEANRCTDCYALDDCGPDTNGAPRICNLSNGRCISGNCLSSSDCGVLAGTTAGEWCDAGQCTSCASSVDCRSHGYSPMTICDEATNLCASFCNQDSECTSNWCNGGRCKPCQNDSECGTGRVCANSICREGNCTETSDCASHLCVDYHCSSCYSHADCGPGRVCNTSTQQCIVGDCLSSVHCGLPDVAPGTLVGQVCRDQICSPCVDDGECLAYGYPLGTICEAGRCVRGCASDTDCLSTNNCQAGRCKGCAFDSECDPDQVCDEGVGVCVDGDCANDVDCANNQVGQCSNSVCTLVSGRSLCVAQHLPLGTPCEDGSLCTLNDTCANGLCGPGNPACDDNKPCTLDTCTVGSCTHQQIEGWCYINGECFSHGDVNSAVNECEECVATGTSANPNEWSIDNTNPCTTHDGECSSSQCVSGTCEWVADFQGLPCTPDGVDCTFDYCDQGACSHPGDNTKCEDTNECTANRCQPYGCEYPRDRNTLTCDDGDPVTNGDFCWNTQCFSMWRTLTITGAYPFAYSRSDELIASATLDLSTGRNDGTVKLWDANTGLLLRTLSGHSEGVSLVRFSPNGNEIATFGGDASVKFWNVNTGGLLRSYTFSSHPRTFAWGPNGDTFAVVPSSVVTLVATQSGATLRTFAGNAYNVTSLAFSPDGSILAGGSRSTVLLWETSTGNLIRTFSFEAGSWAGAVDFSPDGVLVGAAYFGNADNGPGANRARLWDVSNGALQREITLSPYSYASMEFSPLPEILAIGGSWTGNGTWAWIALFDNGELMQQAYGSLGGGEAIVTFNGTGTKMANSIRSTGTIAVWDLSGVPSWAPQCTADSDCSLSEFCNLYLHRCVASQCADGQDNDGDSLVDALDPDCAVGVLELVVN